MEADFLPGPDDESPDHRSKADRADALKALFTTQGELPDERINAFVVVNPGAQQILQLSVGRCLSVILKGAR